MRETNKFHFFIFSKLFHRVLSHGDEIISWWRICRWLAVKFEIHLCSSGVDSDLGECFFWGLCKPVIASTGLWPQEMFNFWKCMQMVARLRGLVWKQFRCHPGGRVCLPWEACGASCTHASCNTPKTLWTSWIGRHGVRRWLQCKQHTVSCKGFSYFRMAPSILIKYSLKAKPSVCWWKSALALHASHPGYFYCHGYCDMT